MSGIMEINDSEDQAHLVLRTRFGLGGFRDGQQRVITTVMQERPALAVFPTGGGKSLCYQLPAELLDGLVLVVSPLIALMKDQVDALRAKGIAAARLDSTLGEDGIRRVLEQAESGVLRLLYVAPERLTRPDFRHWPGLRRIVMIAIDEAHCISEWGHHFRPDYLKLAGFCRRLKLRRVLALTATATPAVARDIRRQFRIAARDEVRLPYFRPNLDLRITPCTPAQRMSLLVEKLESHDGSVVVYVTRQETSEEVATALCHAGITARAYHAGLTADVRGDAQQAFMTGKVRVMVATIAFGMGVDKPDIRSVIHYNLPKSLEGYAQETGRAGRDGSLAVCDLLACGDDLTVLGNFIGADHPSLHALRSLVGRVMRLGTEFDISIRELSLSTDLRISTIGTVIAHLESRGILESLGTHHQRYRIRPLHSHDRMLHGHPANQRRLLRRILSHGRAAWGAIEFEPTDLARLLGVRRERIIAALSSLEAAGDAVMEASGVRHAFRVKREPESIVALADEMADLFVRRREADLGRLHDVAAFCASRTCLAARLARHFGTRNAGACGQCDRCRGLQPARLQRPSAREVSEAEWLRIREIAARRHPALAAPEQLTRFLCGMRSPATVHGKLTRDPGFGMLADVSFDDVLPIATAVT